jgi:hypothetical protein
MSFPHSTLLDAVIARGTGETSPPEKAKQERHSDSNIVAASVSRASFVNTTVAALFRPPTPLLLLARQQQSWPIFLSIIISLSLSCLLQLSSFVRFPQAFFFFLSRFAFRSSPDPCYSFFFYLNRVSLAL